MNGPNTRRAVIEILVLVGGYLAITLLGIWAVGAAASSSFATAPGGQQFMQTTNIILAVLLHVVAAAMVIRLLFVCVRYGWNDLADLYPAVPAAPGAVRRTGESVSFSWFNWGMCADISADEDFLHISPAFIARWFRARPMSIPWTEFEKIGRRPRFTCFTRVEIAGWKLALPEWCISGLRNDAAA